ncbi:hypothetical protein KIL84_022491 [Mauremys mutica]|uniref:Uncharacterized protein n=1 Tax=Mauremys mutica TaxID=74926 RepID=A0A9D3WNF9_9SAUR|nr:hypothetical protein KIL84_022491 [Mauremys mutica]
MTDQLHLLVTHTPAATGLFLAAGRVHLQALDVTPPAPVHEYPQLPARPPGCLSAAESHWCSTQGPKIHTHPPVHKQCGAWPLYRASIKGGPFSTGVCNQPVAQAGW